MGSIIASGWFVWLMIGALALLVELCTTALVSIWFIPSAVLAAITSLFCDSVAIQSLVFLAFSALFLFLFKRFFSGKLRRSPMKDPNEALIGKTATATSDINEDDGKVLVGDVYWRAVATTGKIASGETVRIKSVSGTTLTVEKK